MSKTFLGHIWPNLLDLIFPKFCLSCGREGFFICPDCRQSIVKIKTPYCPTCKKISKNGKYCPDCRANVNLTGVIIAAHFEKGILREAIHAYKYEGIREIRKYLASILAQRMKDNLPRGDKLIIPIPLHPKRQIKRGFNQAEELAKILAQKLSLPVESNILIRLKSTPPQIKLKKKEREKNILNAFYCLQPALIKDKTILLVDDVMTTGTTLNEAGRVLKENGAKNVWGVVIAQG